MYHTYEYKVQLFLISDFKVTREVTQPKRLKLSSGLKLLLESLVYLQILLFLGNRRKESVKSTRYFGESNTQVLFVFIDVLIH